MKPWTRVVVAVDWLALWLMLPVLFVLVPILVPIHAVLRWTGRRGFFCRDESSYLFNMQDFFKATDAK